MSTSAMVNKLYMLITDVIMNHENKFAQVMEQSKRPDDKMSARIYGNGAKSCKNILGSS